MQGRNAYYPRNQKYRHTVAMTLRCCECGSKKTFTLPACVPETPAGSQAEVDYLYSEFYRIGWRRVKAARPVCRKCRRDGTYE